MHFITIRLLLAPYTTAELGRIRQSAVRRGHAVNDIHTLDDYRSALVKGCSPAFLDDLLGALETGSSRLMRGEVTYDELLRG